MMQDRADELLHLGDLATGTLPAGMSFEHDRATAQSILAEEDMISIKQVLPAKVPEWCLARIAGYRDHIRLLRELYDPSACTAIWATKSHIRALRSEFNAFAPINRLLPPEVLIEVFSNVHPAVLYSWRMPILHVCRYWRRLVLKTPQFWANLLTLRRWHAPKFNWRIGRFTAALTLSAPVDLTLSLPFGSLYEVVNIMMPHADRLAFLKINSAYRIVYGIERLLKQHMPRLKDLIIIDRAYDRGVLPLTLYFQRYPNIHALRLGLTISYSITAPCASLHHLELSCCTMHASGARTPRGGSYLPSTRSVHDALGYFPNLETLVLICALSERHSRHWSGDLPELTKTVHLPRLRRLKIAEDGPTFIQCFLSHLAFPSTTSLVLELNPRFDLFYDDLVLGPVFPLSTNPSPGAPDEAGSEISTSISLFLDFLSWEVPVRWETHDEGIRPVHITLGAAARELDTTAHFIRELVHDLAPARGVTALTAQGTRDRTSGDIGLYNNGVREYWAAFLPDLAAGIRRLVCTTGETTKDLVHLLGRPSAQSGEFPCGRLEDLALAWALPPGACVELGESGGEEAEEQPESDSEARGDADESVSEVGVSEDAEDEAEYRASGLEVAASLRELCDMLQACLAERAGHCEPIRTLLVTLRGWYRWYSKVPGWQPALVERQLRDALGHLVREVSVVEDVH